jgi:hypothetical protein
MREVEEQRADLKRFWFFNLQQITRHQNLNSLLTKQLTGLSYWTQIERVSKSLQAACVNGH